MTPTTVITGIVILMAAAACWVVTGIDYRVFAALLLLIAPVLIHSSRQATKNERRSSKEFWLIVVAFILFIVLPVVIAFLSFVFSGGHPG
jgi:hypothetical protein